MTFKELLIRNGRENLMQERLLCIDPGNETGNCTFLNGELVDCWQTPTAPDGELDFVAIESMFKRAQPTVVVCENFKLYQHKMKEQSFSEFPTIRIIGVIAYLCWQQGIPLHFQMAMQAKGFATDAKLKSWGFWQTGMRHSRDAIRHGIYWLLFSKSC